MRLKQFFAACFMMVFLLIICTPTIIASIDDTIDATALVDINEEEELEDFKLLLEKHLEHAKLALIENSDLSCVTYTNKNYTKPHIHLISPPPETYFW